MSACSTWWPRTWAWTPSTCAARTLSGPRKSPTSSGPPGPALPPPCSTAATTPRALEHALERFGWDELKPLQGRKRDGRYHGIGIGWFVKNTGLGAVRGRAHRHNRPRERGRLPGHRHPGAGPRDHHGADLRRLPGRAHGVDHRVPRPHRPHALGRRHLLQPRHRHGRQRRAPHRPGAEEAPAGGGLAAPGDRPPRGWSFRAGGVYPAGSDQPPPGDPQQPSGTQLPSGAPPAVERPAAVGHPPSFRRKPESRRQSCGQRQAAPRPRRPAGDDPPGQGPGRRRSRPSRPRNTSTTTCSPTPTAATWCTWPWTRRREWWISCGTWCWKTSAAPSTRCWCTARPSRAAAQGIGGTLLEELAYNEDGQLLTTTLLDYPLPSATEIPPVESIITEYSPLPPQPLGRQGRRRRRHRSLRRRLGQRRVQCAVVPGDPDQGLAAESGPDTDVGAESGGERLTC